MPVNSMTRSAGRDTFRFFDLPSEIRAQIFQHVFVLGITIDIHVNVHALLSNTLVVSKQFCEEAAAAFYGRNTFRILPTHPRAAGKYARPLLQDLSSWHRSRLVSLELRLGPFWTFPPKCWEINGRLGLEEAVRVRVLEVFVEVDPSLAIFNGFRSLKLNYPDFASELLQSCIDRLPSLTEIRFDAYFTASRGAPLLDRLVELARKSGKRVSWGPNQQAIDRERAAAAAEPDVSTVDVAYETARQGMVPFYSSSLYRQSLPKNILS